MGYQDITQQVITLIDYIDIIKLLRIFNNNKLISNTN